MVQAQVLGIVIGGLIPAVLFSLNGVLNKAVVQTGMGLSYLLLFTGIGVILSSIPFFILVPGPLTQRGILFSVGSGFAWGIGLGLVSVAIFRFRIGLSILAPLYNMNALFVVLLSLWIFAEWRNVQVIKLLVGAVLVVIGGTLVAAS